MDFDATSRVVRRRECYNRPCFGDPSRRPSSPAEPQNWASSSTPDTLDLFDMLRRSAPFDRATRRRHRHRHAESASSSATSSNRLRWRRRCSTQSVLDRTTESQVLDVGTGGGLPSLPIKILLPQLRLTLLDARQRTAAFLDEVLRSLGIDGVDIVVRARGGRRPRPAVSRAVRRRAGAGTGATAGASGVDAALPARRRASCGAEGKRRTPRSEGVGACARRTRRRDRVERPAAGPGRRARAAAGARPQGRFDARALPSSSGNSQETTPLTKN